MSHCLIIIDPQNSFCKKVAPELQQLLHDGELCVPGAWEDMERLAAHIGNQGDEYDQIVVTGDCHPWVHVAHPDFYVDSVDPYHGAGPQPFSTLKREGTSGRFSDGTGVFRFADESLKIDDLNEITIWPPHCIAGTPGSLIVEPLARSLIGWQKYRQRSVDYLIKGQDPYHEQFSAWKATGYKPLEYYVKNYERLSWAGEALSHCVAQTVEDAVAALGNGVLHKSFLLRNATSSVPGYEAKSEALMDSWQLNGLRLGVI